MTEAKVMVLELLIGFIGGAFMVGVAWMALRAKIEANRVAQENISQDLQEHEAECKDRQERVWRTLDDIRKNVAEINTTVTILKEKRDA